MNPASSAAGAGSAIRSTLADLAQLAAASLGVVGGTYDEDAPLVRRCKSGDMTAYRRLVERHERRVYAIVSRILSTQLNYGDRHTAADVEDLAQEVFVQAWRALPGFRGEARFSTWLYRIATNRALKEWRRAQRQPGQGWCDAEIDGDHGPATEHGEPQYNHYDPEALVQLGARDKALRTAIDALPEKQRVVILLHYFEDYSCEEIAQFLDCSVGTIWSRLHYACRKLRGRMSGVEIMKD